MFRGDYTPTTAVEPADSEFRAMAGLPATPRPRSHDEPSLTRTSWAGLLPIAGAFSRGHVVLIGLVLTAASATGTRETTAHHGPPRLCHSNCATPLRSSSRCPKHSRSAPVDSVSIVDLSLPAPAGPDRDRQRTIPTPRRHYSLVATNTASTSQTLGQPHPGRSRTAASATD
jgi:hypothetical protein